MDEKSQIIFMQTRLVRRASEKLGVSIQDASRLFDKYQVFHFIKECFGIFHMEGDDAILEDIAEFLSIVSEQKQRSNVCHL